MRLLRWPNDVGVKEVEGRQYYEFPGTRWLLPVIGGGGGPGRPELLSPTGRRSAGLIQPAIMQSRANPGANTFNHIGYTTNPTTTGTLTSADQVDGPYVQIASGAVTNNEGRLLTGFNIARASWLPELNVLMRTPSDIANSRYWIGMFSATPAGSADPAVHGAAFRGAFSTNAEWRSWSNDGTSTGTINVGPTMVVSTAWRMRIISYGIVGSNSTFWEFWMDDEKIATHVANLPGGSSNNLGWFVGVQTLVALAKNILICRVYWSHN